jgi:hypothetical protein
MKRKPRRKRSLWQMKRIKRTAWERLHGFHQDEEAYFEDRGCDSCRRMFRPKEIWIPRACGQMLLDGVREADVSKGDTCDLLLTWE